MRCGSTTRLGVRCLTCGALSALACFSSEGAPRRDAADAGVAGAGGTGSGPSGAGVSGAGGVSTSGAGGAGGAGPSGSGSAGGSGASELSRLDALLTRELFDALFPNRNELYSYDALLAAGAAYPEFAATGTLGERQRELAAWLGNIAHETTGGWPTAPGGPEAWGLYFTQEVGCEDGSCTQYCDASNAQYPCAAGKTYHGRGPIQLSWNYNYGAFGAALGLDLLGDPDLVTSDGEIAFRTALWFWMTAQPPKPSAHDAVLGRWTPSSADQAAGRAPGFGMTMNIINGGLECGKPADTSVLDRIRFYRHFVTLFGTTEGDNVECEGMRPY
jgi:basic endochitinase B